MSYRERLASISQRIYEEQAHDRPDMPADARAEHVAAHDPTDPSTIKGRYAGGSQALFYLAFKTGLLTVLTLGIYRFWARTRIRRYMWSATTPDGKPFEYTGTGLEKLLGFLIAVVILAVYLGLINLGLTFAGLAILSGNEEQLAIALNLSLLASLPLIFLAQYRGRRYVLSRTRWRGIRFGVEQGAVGYMLRVIGYGVLAGVTLGLLLPLLTFKLEAYRVNRTWFGDARMHQGGHWTALYPAMKHLFIGVALIISAAILSLALDLAFLGVALAIAGYIWAFLGLLHYQVRSFAILARHKRLGDDIQFTAAPQTKTVLYYTLVGGLVVGIIAAVLFTIIGSISLAILNTESLVALLSNPEQLLSALSPLLVVPFLLYIVALVALQALTLVYIRQPILSHYVTTLTLQNKTALARIKQRSGDQMADADGFSDALDVGAGI